MTYNASQANHYNQQMAQRSALYHQQEVMMGRQARPKPPPAKENLPLGFPHPYHPDYAQKLGEWNVQHGRAPTDTPSHISKPPMNQKPYEDPKIKLQLQLQQKLQQATQQVAQLNAQIGSVQVNAKGLETNISNLQGKTQETQERQVLQAEKINALAACQESNNNTVANVMEKVGAHEEEQIRLAAELRDEKVVSRKLKIKSKSLKTTIKDLKNNLKETQEKVEALIGQNREALALANEEKRKREEFEQQMREMTEGFREMKMVLSTTQAELQEVKKQAQAQQVDRSRLEVATAQIDLRNRRNSREFPPSRIN